MSDLQFRTYGYVPKDIELSLGSTNYAFDRNAITYVNILHEYTERRLPVIQVGLEASSALLGAFYSNLDSAVMKLELHEISYDSNHNQVGTSLYMKHSFTMVPARAAADYMMSTDTATEEQVDTMTTSTQLLEVYLIDMTAVNWFNAQHSAIYKSINVASSLQAIYQTRGVPSGILMATPPENNASKSHVILPLDDLAGNITHLNKMYGLYTGPLVTYYDMKYMYCLNRIAPNITLGDSTDYGNVTLRLASVEDPTRLITGSCNDSVSQTHYINLQSPPIVTRDSYRDTSAKFSTVTAVNNSGSVTKQTVDSNSSALAYIYAHCDMSINQFINRHLSGGNITVEAANISLNTLRPYKVFNIDATIQYNHLGYSGKYYYIHSWATCITRRSNDEFSHTVAMTLTLP